MNTTTGADPTSDAKKSATDDAANVRNPDELRAAVTGRCNGATHGRVKGATSKLRQAQSAPFLVCFDSVVKSLPLS
ncbi:MAG: hypothetical protein M3Q07_17900, partial [Pseudobdellovibrionaceae bacterium]|nr:hypothetical protein [Pseudobdellovibrionaceae bacterium]